MDTIWIVIAGIGITFILKYSYILRHPRNWVANLCETTKEFTNCCMCMGFWVGFFLKLCSLLITNGINTLHDVYVCVLLGFIVSITSFFGDVLLECLEFWHVKAIDVSTETDVALEIWIAGDDDEVNVMYFFPYDNGVIACR